MSDAIPAWTLRRPTAADAAALAAFGAAQFVATFGFNYPKADLDAFLSTTYTTEKWASLIVDPSQFWCMAVDESGDILGYVQAAPMGLPYHSAPKAVELCKLYVSETAKGSGLAMALHQVVLNWARDVEAPELFLGVWAHNPRAQAFYRKLGFEAVGAYQFVVGNTLDDEVIMRLSL
jgi:diamine N-acetyltransferase